MRDLKWRIRGVMLAHLQSKGYPQMTSEEILQELKPMWVKLEEANLIQPGWHFSAFTVLAHQMAEQDRIFRILKGEEP